MSQAKARLRNGPVVGAGRLWMPLVLVLGGLVLLGGMIFALLDGGHAARVRLEAQGVPRLKVDKRQVDLGDVMLGQTVEVSFELSNTGDQPLRFSESPYVEVVEGC